MRSFQWESVSIKRAEYSCEKFQKDNVEMNYARRMDKDNTADTLLQRLFVLRRRHPR